MIEPDDGSLSRTLDISERQEVVHALTCHSTAKSTRNSIIQSRESGAHARNLRLML